MESVHSKYGENWVATGTERTKLFCLVNISEQGKSTAISLLKPVCSVEHLYAYRRFSVRACDVSSKQRSSDPRRPQWARARLYAGPLRPSRPEDILLLECVVCEKELTEFLTTCQRDAIHAYAGNARLRAYLPVVTRVSWRRSLFKKYLH